MAWGAGGQHAFVVPAYDLVVVNRVDRDQQLPEPKLSEVKQLLSLTLKAGPSVAEWQHCMHENGTQVLFDRGP